MTAALAQPSTLASCHSVAGMLDDCQLWAEPRSPLELAHPGSLPALLEPYAGLTLAALGRDAAAWIDDYQRSEPTLDTRPEDGFLEFVIARTDGVIPRRVARFERAVSSARRAHEHPEPAAAPSGQLRLHPAACVVDLPGPADQVIAAIALGIPVPPYVGWPVLIAPGLPTLWRQATPTEDALCTWLTCPRDRDDVLARFAGAERVLARLLQARAIIDGA